MKISLPLIAWFSASIISASVASAQTQAPGMSLMGNVQSDSQQPLPGAAITVIHMPTGTRHATASDASGRFAVANLPVGGPYLIRVGEGGYRPQTLENVFLGNGKTADFTVTLNRLNGSKAAAGRPRAGQSSSDGDAVALAPEAVVGGPILLTSISGQAQPASSVPAHAPAAAAASHPLPAPVSVAVSAAQVPAASAPVATTPAVPAARPYRYSSRRSSAARVADPIVPGHYDAKSGNYFYETGPVTTLKLANGSAITGVGTNSTESNLYRFLTDPQVQVDSVDLTRGWYNFDRVYFEAGKATLTAESLNQLHNVAILLRAYPKSRVKLGGYTDDTGTYKINKELSEARARTAWASLVEMGISPGRIDARGYGPNYSISSNATEEGRAMNRRLSVKVLQK
jgi:outer membrane protein OmpA-like peptidoglycan-associated protein